MKQRNPTDLLSEKLGATYYTIIAAMTKRLDIPFIPPIDIGGTETKDDWAAPAIYRRPSP